MRGARKRLTWTTLLFLSLLLAVGLGLATPAEAAAGEIKGTITNATTGTPMRLVQVFAAYWDGTQWLDYGQATTDSLGAYRIYNDWPELFGPGQYRVYTWARDFYRAEAWREWDMSGSLVVDLQLSPYTLVATGTVTDASTGLPVSGATVTAEGVGADGQYDHVSATTAEDGTYELYGGFASEFEMTADAEGYSAATIETSWDRSHPAAADLELTPDTLLFAFGRVTDGDTGEGLPGAIVNVYYSWDIGFDQWVQMTTIFAEDGTYVVPLRDAVLGYDIKYKVVAGRMGYATAESPELRYDGFHALRADLAPMPAPPLASGHIRDKSSAADLSGVSVSAYVERDFGYEQVGGGTTGADGTYELWDWMGGGAGHYRIETSKLGYISERTYVDWDGVSTVEADFELFAPATVFATGRVTDFVTRAPIADAAIFVDGSGSAAGRTGEDGRFTIQNQFLNGPGWYTFHVTARGYQSKSYTFEWDGMAPMQVESELGDPRVIVGGSCWAKDDITKRDYPLTNGNVKVSAYRKAEDGSWALAGESDSNGYASYEVRDENRLGAGDYKLVAHSEYYEDVVLYRTWNGSDKLSVTFTFVTYTGVAQRPPAISVSGADRFATAVAASVAAYPDGLSEEGSRTVVIASGSDWPDALSAASLAGALDGPVLLVRKDDLPPIVAEEIRRLGTCRAIVVGGPAAVGDVVEARLRALLGEANVERVAGPDRYRTAQAVAARSLALSADDGERTVFVASGATFPDAVAAAPIAAAKGWPLVLVPPRGGLPAATGSAIAGAEHAVVLGGPEAVNGTVERDLRTLLGPEAVTRLGGDDRYATAVIVATYGVDHAGLAWDRVGLATGTNFPDALAGGVTQGDAGSVMLLARPASLPSVTKTTLAAHKAHIATVTFYGGSSALAPTVREAALDAVR